MVLVVGNYVVQVGRRVPADRGLMVARGTDARRSLDTLALERTLRMEKSQVLEKYLTGGAGRLMM